MEDHQYTEERLVEAFQAMWGKYPESVRLIRKDFTVIANNDPRTEHICPTGSQCNSVGAPEMHQGCKAQEALRKQQTICIEGKIPNTDISLTSFWIPVAGAPDYYIHFSNGLNEHAEALSSALLN